jgi:hypothetical protein
VRAARPDPEKGEILKIDKGLRGWMGVRSPYRRLPPPRRCPPA